MTGQQLSDLLRIAFRLRYLAQCMEEEGFHNYALSIGQFIRRAMSMKVIGNAANVVIVPSVNGGLQNES